MVQLNVHWRNSTRPEQERERIELAMEEAALEHFNGVSNAFQQRHEYELQGKPAGHPWIKGIVKAQDIATKGYAPCQRQFFRFAFTFTDG